jgi:protein-tyrosine phosphatase
MRFACFFALLAAGCVGSAWLDGGAAWLLLWPAASCAGVALALAYAGLGPCLLGKRRDGRLAGWAIGLFLPYLVPTWLLWYVQRLLTREPACTEVQPGLWLGRRLLPHELPPGIGLVVDLTAEFCEPVAIRASRCYVCLPILDGMVPSLDALRHVIAQIVQASGPVLVHCASGHGRSAMVVAGVLLQRGLAHDAADAERILKALRPRIGLSPGQRQTVARLAS